MIQIAQIGVGYWGPNLLRNLVANKDCEVKTVVDMAQERRDFVKNLYPAIKVSGDIQDVAKDRTVNAVVIATPVKTHYELAKMMLNKAGYQVEVANNGQEAVEKYTKSPEDFDLVFMDVQMPKMDGMDATKAIREKGFDSIPIVAMTAHAMKGDMEKCLKVGMDDYISKPIKRELVFEILEKWVFSRGFYRSLGIQRKS